MGYTALWHGGILTEMSFTACRVQRRPDCSFSLLNGKPCYRVPLLSITRTLDRMAAGQLFPPKRHNKKEGGRQYDRRAGGDAQIIGKIQANDTG